MKKTHIEWAPGLAMYEKQKVQGSLNLPVVGANSNLANRNMGMTATVGCPAAVPAFSPRSGLPQGEVLNWPI